MRTNEVVTVMGPRGRARRNPPDDAARTGPVSLRVWIGVTVFCVSLFWVSVPTAIALYDLSLPMAFVTATVQCATVALALKLPKTATVLHLAAVVVVGLASRAADEGPWPLSVTGLLALGALLAVLGVRERWGVALAAWWLSICALVAVVIASPGQFANSDSWDTGMMLAFSFTLLVVAGSIFFGQRRSIRADLIAARRDWELEQAQRRYVEERARLARDLHDVVAHSMSIIHIQATSAPYRLDHLDEQAAAEFAQIARSARTALGEMRQLLGALRADEDRAELAPQPQIADIGRLAQVVERAGTRVEIHSDVGIAAVSPLIQLTIYRIVQEGLSNVVRHAPGAPARVSLTAEPDHARVVVDNAATAASDRSRRITTDTGGQGLHGMRERVELLGGTLTSGPTDTGGFHLEARIPTVSAGGPAAQIEEDET